MTGIDNPLNCELPQPMEDRALEECYRELRFPIDEASQEVARQKMIANYYRLTIAICCNYKQKHSFRINDIVSEALCELVAAVNRLKLGAIDGHEKPNVTGYIISCLSGRINKFISKDRIFAVRIETHKKMVEKIQVFTYDPLFEPQKIDSHFSVDEVKELVAKAIKNDFEKKVIELRVAGLKDAAIGVELGKSGQRIGQVRRQVVSRIKEHLDAYGH